MPDQQAGVGLEGREREVVVVAVLEDRGIGPVPGEQGIEEAAVAEIGHALVVEAAAPFRGGGLAGIVGASGRPE
jgi:hypothetical protein